VVFVYEAMGWFVVKRKIDRSDLAAVLVTSKFLYLRFDWAVDWLLLDFFCIVLMHPLN
jgi:hypothetical protein